MSWMLRFSFSYVATMKGLNPWGQINFFIHPIGMGSEAGLNPL